MAYCKVRQAELFYEDIGEGTPIIMIHGYSPDHRLMSGCMEPVFEKRNGWRRIYIDLPGMGQSRNYHEISSSDEMLNAVVNFIQTIIPDQDYVVVGESYGGYIARGIIHTQIQRILGAAFICPVIKPYAKDRTVGQHQIVKTDKKFIETLTQSELEDFRSNNVVLDESTWLRYNQEILSGVQIADKRFLEKVHKNYGFSFEVDQSDFIRPSLFLLGKQDSIVGYKDALELQEKYPRGTFVALDGAGHNLQIEQPLTFNALVHEWLDRLAD
ncbi:2-hydroxy-6-oxo-6-phenylhexa-2,4-dienoate hydrolase [Bacillus sp. LL01]|uniref:alpha/beta fold hydrolase n=1 Tax=Bacillus sp. LL01 TaxID=1665556 RepID=UPI00064D3F7B|nr:alpha/beta hydrolase [Bacillus sp. LL01]KMJ57170.1 2-hydroxy-6-oxo-6-phenylhexa-2,4-dienoate hydrolase [Bacillus sp. LL01]